MQEPNEQPNETEGHAIVHEPRYWLITALAVAVTALLVGGGMWWWMNGKLEAQRADLAPQAAEDNSKDVSYTDWQEYQNEEYKFKIMLPSSWGGFRVVREDNVFSFELPTTSDRWPYDHASIFTIIVYPRNYWGSLGEFEGPLPRVLGDLGGEVYVVDLFDEVPDDREHVIDEIDQILSTFEFIDNEQISAADWQVYSSPAYYTERTGISWEVKFPPTWKNSNTLSDYRSTDNFIYAAYLGDEVAGGGDKTCFMELGAFGHGLNGYTFKGEELLIVNGYQGKLKRWIGDDGTVLEVAEFIRGDYYVTFESYVSDNLLTSKCKEDTLSIIGTFKFTN